MRASADGRQVGFLLVLGFVVVTAGCVGGPGTKTYTGSNASAGNIHIQSAKVVDGTLRRLTIANNGSSAVPGGTWRIRLDGTSNNNAATFNTTVDVGSIPENASTSMAIDKRSQSDWQDGAKLTIQATTPGEKTISIVIKPK